MIDKHLVVVSRKWHEPFVRVSVTDLDIKVVISLEDFAQAVAHDTGLDATKLSAAFDKVITELKKETAKAV